ncbi:flagellar biosynthesis, putative [Babesia ovata]|uniref:Flagellar biosynthesis, putative n=1 Tax=Babesia ovata TaxID=189622 RepID=A0A2H6KFP1_9APIC|nr:flagellar biosynthesis, putative [Babesia ovata]GBE61806.1 flagellar biosynthesis, putative [Babesia ovata]
MQDTPVAARLMSGAGMGSVGDVCIHGLLFREHGRLSVLDSRDLSLFLRTSFAIRRNVALYPNIEHLHLFGRNVARDHIADGVAICLQKGLPFGADHADGFRQQQEFLRESLRQQRDEQRVPKQQVFDPSR